MARSIAAPVAALLLALVPGARAAEQSEFPPRQITLLLGTAAGSVTDSIARLVAPRMAQRLGVPVIVENRAGASQLIAIRAVRAAPPNGSMLFFAAGSALQTPAVRSDLDYEPLRDFTFVALSAVTPGAIVARPSLPAASVKELIDYAKANPDKLSFGSSGPASAGHLQMEYFMRQTQTRMAHIPYKSDTQVAVELAEGRIDVAIFTIAAAMPMTRAGRLKLLALTTPRSLAVLPGVPNLAEAGVAGLEGLDPFTFFGVLGPAGMPVETVRLLNQAHNDATAAPETAARLRETFFSEPVASPPEAFRRLVEAELAKWGAIGKNLKLQQM